MQQILFRKPIACEFNLIAVKLDTHCLSMTELELITENVAVQNTHTVVWTLGRRIFAQFSSHSTS